MAHSLAEALARAHVVKEDDALLVEEMRRMKLRQMEKRHVKEAAAAIERDEKDVQHEARYVARASRETVRPGGNTSSKAYLARFRK